MDATPCPEFVFEVLRCPLCRGGLERRENALRCECGAEYAVSGGTPVMRPEIRDAAECAPPENTFYTKYFMKKSSLLGRLFTLFGSTYIPYPFDYQAHIDKDGLVLNIGAGMTPPFLPRMATMDFFKYPGVSLVGDAQQLPFADNTFDAVICESMIEHVPDPDQALAEMARVLRPGGKLYISYPFLVLYHDVPGDYTRFTIEGMRTRLCRNGQMRQMHAGVLTGASCRMISATADFFCAFFTSEKIRFAVRAAVLLALFPVRYFDRILNKKPDAAGTAVFLYGLFRKNGTEETVR